LFLIGYEMNRCRPLVEHPGAVDGAERAADSLEGRRRHALPEHAAPAPRVPLFAVGAVPSSPMVTYEPSMHVGSCTMGRVLLNLGSQRREPRGEKHRGLERHS
jgi:hypothetical protein